MWTLEAAAGESHTVTAVAQSQERGSAEAFGAPGIAPTWSSSDKDFVTTALDGSRLWATIGHGIINEVYWPTTGHPQIRDWGFYLVGEKRWISLTWPTEYFGLGRSAIENCMPQIAR